MSKTHSIRLRPLCHAVQLALVLGLAAGSGNCRAAAAVPLTNLNGNNGFRLDGTAAADLSGVTISAAGDINDDGIDDLIVGAPGADLSGADSGSSYVVFGRPEGNPFTGEITLSSLGGSTGFRLDGNDSFDFSGLAVATVGDINGDDIDDLVVGARGVEVNGIDNAGRSYVLYGRSGGEATFPSVINLSTISGSNGFQLDGVALGDFSGWAVAAAGDINGDGLDDLIVGAPYANPNNMNDAGSSYVVFGRTGGTSAFTGGVNLADLNGSNGFRLDGVAAGDRSGWSIATAGDINGDNIDDLIVGAYLANPNDSGSSYVLFGRSQGTPFASVISLASLDGTTGFRLDGVAAGDQSGRAVATAGDINGDGLDDLIVGARNADFNGGSSGSSYVLFGRPQGTPFGSGISLASLSGSTGFRLDGAAYAQSGWSVAAAGDLNGDGFDDLVVGAPRANPTGSISGSSYVLFGRTTAFANVINLSSLNGNTGLRLDGVAAEDYNGLSVAVAGDINDDGLRDLIVGAPGADPSGFSSGSSYIVFGNNAPLVDGGPAALPTIVEDSTDPAGTRIDVLAAPFYLDNQPLVGAGLTISAPISTDGIWQYRLNAGAWAPVPTAGLANNNALVLLADSELRFLPASDFVGTAPFLSIRLWDGTDNYLAGAGRNILASIGGLGGFSNDANLLQVTVTVIAQNTAPTTSPVTLTAIAEDSGIREITQAELLVNAADADDDSLTANDLAIASGSGSLVDNGNGTWDYTPALNDDTGVSFSYTISDGVETVAGSATLDITPVNDAPTTSSVTLAAIIEDSGPRVITQAQLLGNASDTDNPSLSATELVIAAGNGSLSDNGNGTWNYTPAANDDTEVSFSYSISDGIDDVAGSAMLDITPVNDAPITNPVMLAAIIEDSGPRVITQAELLINAADADNDGLTANDLAIASGSGDLIDNGNGTWNYMPVANDDTGVSFSYTITDGIEVVAGSATLDITPVNDAPSVSASTPMPMLNLGQVIIPNWAAFSPGPVNESAQSVAEYVITEVTNAGLFTEIPTLANNGTLSYTPANGVTGISNFTVQVRDSGGTADGGVDLSPGQTFTITILGTLIFSDGFEN